MVTTRRRVVNCSISARQPQGMRGRRQWKGIIHWDEQSTLTSGALKPGTQWKQSWIQYGQLCWTFSKVERSTNWTKSTVLNSTLLPGFTSRHQLHDGSCRRGTTALGREDSDIHFTSHFTLYSHNLHFNTYYCNCMSSSSSSSSFICEREYNKPTWQSIIIEQMSAQDSHATRGCSNATSVHRDFFDYCTS